MSNERTFSKKEISKILNKASEIQTQKDLYGDREGLNEQELVDLAKEVGIDKSSLLEALEKINEPDLDKSFNWIKGTAKVQQITTVEGEISEEHWDEVVQEIRRINGGIGKLIRTSSSFEWEQRMQEIGYKHISFTPQKGKTKIQSVSSWGPLRFLILFMSSFMAGAALLVFLKGVGIPKSTSVLFSPLGGLAGYSLGILFLKSRFNKEKEKLKRIVAAVSNKIRGFKTPSIEIEEKEVLENDQNSYSAPSKIRS